MAALIRSHDWAITPLGDIGGWPQNLKTIVDLVLGCPSSMGLVWGEGATFIYNDALSELLKGHRGVLMGRSAYDISAGFMGTFRDDLAIAMSGRSAQLVGRCYPLLRNGRLEDAWFDVDHAPIHDEDGIVAGVLCTLKETTEQIRAQKDLRASETRHRLLVETLAQATWETDAEGFVVEDSPSWRAYTGQTKDEWLGHGWLNAIHPEDRKGAEHRWREAIAAGERIDAEFRLRSRAGGWRWTNVRASPVHDDAGRIQHWVGLNIDINARKLAEKALREREADLARVQRTGQVGGLDVDVLNGLTSHRSPEYLRLHGLLETDAEETHACWLQRVHPQDRDGAEKALLDALNGTCSSYEGEYRIIRPSDGAVRWIAAKADIERDGAGRAVRLVGAHVDVTEQKRAQLSLRESEKWQQVLIAGVPQLVWRAINGGHWTWASPQWTQFTGQGEAESHGLGWLDPVHPDDRDRVRQVWTGAISRGEFHADYRVRHQTDGRFRWFQTRATLVRDSAGEALEWLGTSTDVQDLRGLQERQRFLLNELQHRVRNTLAVVRSLARSTGQTSETKEEFEANFEGRLSALARTQMVLTRSPGGGVALEDMVRDELLAQAAQDGQVLISGPEVIISAKAVEVLSLAIHELATNSVKYGALGSARPGKVTVRWTTAPNMGQTWLMLTWKESGVRIASAAPRREGFGTELIEQRVPYELQGHGTLQYAPGGVICEIRFPLLPGRSILQTDPSISSGLEEVHSG